jgi:glycine C-acetyltransferase
VYLKEVCPEFMALVKDLRENYGIFCSIVVYPVIPRTYPIKINSYGDTHHGGYRKYRCFDAIRDRLTYAYKEIELLQLLRAFA